jgi:hypothetical protein
MKNLICAILLVGLSASAHAHEIWIERDATGPARIYLGEPAEPVPENGDPEFSKLTAPRFIDLSAVPVRMANHIAVEAPQSRDVRLVDDTVFQPWKTDSGKLEGAIFYAREGRQEVQAKLDLEIVPTVAGASTFHVIMNGKPVPQVDVSILDGTKVAQTVKTDAAGLFALPKIVAGRVLLTVNHAVDGRRSLGGQDVDRVYHVSTLSFVVP